MKEENITQPYLSIITPAYQNEKYIEQTVKEVYQDIVARANFSTEVIIAEDGSTDRTREILVNLQKKYQFKLITDPKRKGHVKAIKELYQRTGGELIFYLDSDGECPPKDFWKLYQKLQKDNLDLVIGVRKKRKPFYRNLITKIGSLIANLLFNLKIEDPNCPLRITTSKAAKQIIPETGRLKYNFNLEQLIWAKKLGLTFSQVKVAHRERKSVIFPPTKIAGQAIIAFIEIIKFRLSFS